MASSIFISPFGGVTQSGSGTAFASPVLIPDGSMTAPGLGFSSNPRYGLYNPGGGVAITINGTPTFYANGTTLLNVRSTYGLTWSSSDDATVGPDSGIYRTGAAALALGNGASGDFTGTLKLGTVNAVTAYQANGTPGVTTFGPSAVASITVKNGLITAIS